MSVLAPADEGNVFAELSRFRTAFYEVLSARADAFFELTDALLCADGPVKTPVELSLTAEHRRGYGSLYAALNHGRLDVEGLRDLLVSVPLPRFEGRIVLSVDVSPWLRSDAACSPERLFCHVHGRSRAAAQIIPGWPYSVVAALSPGHRRGLRSWTRSAWAPRTTPPLSPGSRTGRPRGRGRTRRGAGQQAADPDLRLLLRVDGPGVLQVVVPKTFASSMVMLTAVTSSPYWVAVVPSGQFTSTAGKVTKNGGPWSPE